MKQKLNEEEAQKIWKAIDGAKQSDELVAATSKLFAGKHPGIQGLALAELLAMWLAGHHPGMRKTLLGYHVDYVEELVASGQSGGWVEE